MQYRSLMLAIPIVCTLIFLGALYNLSPSTGGDSAVADLGTAWPMTVLAGALAIWTWMLFPRSKSKHINRTGWLIVGTLAVIAATIPLTVSASEISRDATARAYGSIHMVLVGELDGTRRIDDVSTQTETWHIEPVAELRNVPGFGTSIDLYVTSPWAARNLEVKLVLSDGREITCAMTSGYTHVADTITGQCDDTILFEQMGKAPSAIVSLDLGGQ